MPTPAPEQNSHKILTPALLSALVGLLVLAVVTVIVVVAGPDDEPPPSANGSAPANGSGSAKSSATGPGQQAPSSSSVAADPAPNVVTDEDLGVSYRYPVDGYDEVDWAGPADVSAGIVDLLSATSYTACTYEAGSDVLFGLLTSDEGDVAQAAKIAAVDLSKSVWAGSGEATTSDPTPAVEKTTDEGVVGQLVEIDSTRANGDADECGTTTSHIASFAFENSDGQVVVMVSSHRTDGDAVKDADALADDVAAAFQSVAVL